MTLIAWNRAMRMRWAMNRMETISMEASEKNRLDRWLRVSRRKNGRGRRNEEKIYV